jgi:DNA-binding MarR family transcriptional regulator
MAERFLALRERIQRWSARDFKRSSAPPGLTHTQFAILACVEGAEGLNMSALAERLDLSAPTVVRAVDALERKGLVTRVRSVRDHREVTILPTPAGAIAYDQMRFARKKRLLAILSSLSDEELNGLLAGYEALANALDADDADQHPEGTREASLRPAVPSQTAV